MSFLLDYIVADSASSDLGDYLRLAGLSVSIDGSFAHLFCMLFEGHSLLALNSYNTLAFSATITVLCRSIERIFISSTG